jgi:hypothetical protein
MEGGGHNRAGSVVPGVAFGAGQPLAAEHRGFFERRLGADLSSVRVHTDTHASGAARQLGARAFTVGHDIAFARAQFRPDVGEGRRLLAHELAHVVQQQGPARPDVIRRQGPADDPGAAVGATVTGDVLPPPLLVTWGPDPFLVSFARASPGDDLSGLGGAPGDVLMVRLRYEGSLPFGGVGVKDRTWAAGVNVGPRVLSARIRRQGPTFVQLDLYGDSSSFLRIADEPQIDPSSATPGRQHKLAVSLSIGGGSYNTVWVRDPKAKASDLPAPTPEDRPGSIPLARSVRGDVRTMEMPIDGDGDQHAELVLRLGPDSRGTSGSPPSAGQRHIRLGIRRITGETLLDVAGDLAAPATADDLWPQVESITDGDKPTRISLVLPRDTQWLTIEPPKTADTMPAYGVNFAGFHILVPATGARGKIGGVPEAGVSGGIIYNDITLGAWDDRFRLTLQWRSGSRALLGLSPLYRGAPSGGYGVEIAASGILRFQIVEITPVSLGFDLDGDGKADLRLYDALTSPSWNGQDMPERDRNHTVRVVGAAVGGEKSFDFQIRSGLPNRAASNTPEGKTATSNAMAVSGLNEQRKNASYEAQFDQYEMAMMRVRANAASAGAIGMPVYTAWQALSEDMIKLQPQLGPGGTVQPALQNAAASHAAAFNAALSTETSTAAVNKSNWVVSTTSNPYTGETTVRVPGQASRTTGVGPELAGHIAAGRWEQAYAGYRVLVTNLDRWLVKRLTETKGEYAKETREAEFLVASRARLAELERFKPTRVLAVFHPDDQFSAEGGYHPEIPLNLYYYRDGDTWYLKNLTNPDKPYHYKADVGTGENVPPASLFYELDDPDRLPAGIVHYEIPGAYAGEIKVTPRLTWRGFLGYLGIGLAIIGVVASAGTGAVAVIGTWALAGSAVAGGLAAAIDIAEKAEHGDLTATTAIIDIAQIVGAVAGVTALRAGMIAKGGMIAASKGEPLLGAAAQGAVTAQRIYVLAATTRIAADVVTVATMSVEAARQLDEIEAAGGDRASKDRAKALLLAQLAVTGGLVALSIKGELPALGNGRKLVLYTPKGETVPRALVAGSEAPSSLKFSQKDIGPTTGDARMTIEQLAESMRTEGWKGDALQVVELPDGTLVSLDNRRLWAAHQAGLTDVPVTYHSPAEKMPPGWATEGFVLRNEIYRLPDGTLAVGKKSGGQLAFAAGAVPATYGEAALFRTANQGNLPSGGGRFPLGGRYELPRVRGGAIPPVPPQER